MTLPASRAPTSPARLYLARLSPGSRRAQAGALRQIVTFLTPASDRSSFVYRGSPYTHERSNALSEDKILHAPWHLLRPEQVSAIRAQLLHSYSPATARRMLSALRGVLRECWRAGLLTAEARDRLCDVPPVRGSRLQAGRALAPAEVAALLERATARDRALLGVLVGGGLRRAEAASLASPDVSMDGSEAVLRVIGKGDKERTVYLAGWPAEALARWLPAAGGGSLFGLGTGNAVAKAVKRLARRAGVASMSPHDLRRTYASRSLDAGVDLATLQALMGHADPRTTARYDRRGDAAKRAAARRIA